jgi:hypothetical protein
LFVQMVTKIVNVIGWGELTKINNSNIRVYLCFILQNLASG